MAAQAFDHVPDHVIHTDADPVAQQLHRQMAIADMPGDAHHLALVMRVNFQQRLGSCADAHHATRVHGQSIAMAQAHGLGQVQQHLPALLGFQQDAATVTTIEVDLHTVDFASRVPGAGG